MNAIGMKCAAVAVVGRPSAGKSTLVNTLCGGKVSIVSPYPQTTRNRVRGILTRPAAQLVFLDTPGFHLSEKKLNRHLTALVATTVTEADLVLYVVDGSRGFGEEERALATSLAGSAKPVVIALNKVDVAGSAWSEQKQTLSSMLPGASVFEISARGGTGTGDLLERLCSMAPEGPMLYPEAYYTDQPVEFRISEILREKAIGLTRQEVPHALYVKLEDTEFRDGGKTLWVRGAIVVERDSQKGILVGAGGQRIKQIVRDAEKELCALFPYSVRLDVRVKTDRDWRKKEELLRRLIY